MRRWIGLVQQQQRGKLHPCDPEDIEADSAARAESIPNFYAQLAAQLVKRYELLSDAKKVMVLENADGEAGEDVQGKAQEPKFREVDEMLQLPVALRLEVGAMVAVDESVLFRLRSFCLFRIACSFHDLP